jgi:signal transduction histidine kinase
LADVRRELERAREELAAFAHGVHPHELSEGGLPAALRDLTRYSPVLVELDVSPFRLPAPVEDSAYFVCAEALANAGKHAHATRVTVRAHVTDDRLSLSVEDDGVGGADPAGAGLRGLADRVETLGGRIEVSSSPGGGTRILAQLPCTTGPQP